MPPPQPLRRLQQRATAFDFGHSLTSPDRGPEALWQALAETAVRVAGAKGAVVATGDPPVARAIAGTPPVPITIGEAAPGDAPIEGEPPRFAVPIGNESPVGSLTVFAGGDPLFVEDDRVLLGLLAEQAARSAERQEAILERNVLESVLEDQSHELAESQARLDEEARFRVALEAHPGILLVVDPDGRIGYANAQALQSLRFVPDQIRAVHLRDLLTTAPAVGEATHGVQLAEARRRDGTTFPVDYAVSTFDLGGDTYSIAVLTDISERLQTERLRDTFIGMLSHELRTPVTSIYGGSQVLLESGRPPRGRNSSGAHRGRRLRGGASPPPHREPAGPRPGGTRPGPRRRGARSAAARPAVIVERERSLWPGTSIEMTLPPGLPTVRGHDGYVGQVVRNLLSNAANTPATEQPCRSSPRARNPAWPCMSSTTAPASHPNTPTTCSTSTTAHQAPRTGRRVPGSVCSSAATSSARWAGPSGRDQDPKAARNSASSCRSTSRTTRSSQPTSSSRALQGGRRQLIAC